VFAVKDYDVVVAGGSFAGSYFARKIAEKGFRVLVLEKDKRETISPDYDIFHLDRADIERFGLPAPREGDGVWAFEFRQSRVFSAFGRHPKPSRPDVIGLHKRAYIQRLNDWAAEAGAEILYEAAFEDFVYDSGGKICGVAYNAGGERAEVRCRLAADCTGIPAAARTKLPANYGVETFALTAEDVFFVTLRYIRFTEALPPLLCSDSWVFYKVWLAPSGEENGAILGIGANFGYEYAEKMLGLFSRNVKLPPYEVKKIERGRTPYRRPPYSFVGDGFLALGDAACLTKPNNGEGCAAAMVLSEIAAEEAAGAMRGGAYPSRQALWGVNKRYIDAQGARFASLLALLAGVIRHSAKANEYFFRHDIVFSRKLFSGAPDGMRLTARDYLKTLVFALAGVAAGKTRPAEVGAIVKAALAGGKIAAHYAKFPASPDGFDAWKEEADRLWARAGSMAGWKLL